MTKVHGSNAVPATVSRMDRVVATINRVMYPAWASIAIYRETSLALALASLFRGGAVPARQVAMLNVGVFASTVCAVAEMVVTAVLFGRSASRYSNNRTDLKSCAEGHVRFIRTTETARMHSRRVLPADDSCVDDAARARMANGELPPEGQIDGDAAADRMDAPLLDGEARPQGDASGDAKRTVAQGIVAQVDDYARYRAAAAIHTEHRRQLRDDGLAFGRDTVVQGGVAGSNLALIWHGFDVSHVLHLPADVVSVPAATVSGSVLSLIMGVFHIITATVSWRSAIRLRTLAGNARDAVVSLGNRVARACHLIDPARPAGRDVALPVCAALLHHAAHNETEAIRCARHRVFASKCRMAFGATSVVLGGISLVLLLVLGTLSTGGLMFGMAALLAGLAWLTNATIRSHRHAASVNAAVDDLAAAPSLVPPLHQAIRDAVDLLDARAGRGGAYPEARKMLKRMLLELGMTRADFRPLKWAPDAAHHAVRTELADTILRHVAGDAMRRALDGVVPDVRTFVQAR